MSTIAKNHAKSRLSVKAQTLSALAAIVGAVALPQLLHTIGAATGTGTSLGEMLLPMHLPIILVGLLAGPYAGAAAGLLAPLISTLITGMPSTVMVPFMMIELCAYGAFSGILSNIKLPSIAKVLTVQIAGRAVRAGAIVFAVYALGNDKIGLPIIWNSIVTGIPGIVLQLMLIPLIIFGIENVKKHE